MGDKILLLAFDAKEEDHGGIILPDSAKKQSLDFKVIELGTGGLDVNGNEITFQVSKGDRVIVGQFGGDDVDYQGATYKIVKQNEIIAKIEG
jgi:chaperonin GroES